MRLLLNRIVISVTIIIFLCAPVFASGFSIFTHGARGFGLAGAFAAKAGDPSAIFYNPAGIGNITGTRVLVGFAPLLHQSLFEHDPLTSYPTKTILDKKLLFLPTLYFTSRITSRITAGFGIYSPFGFNISWADNWPGQKILTESSLYTFSLNPVMAYRLTSSINVAVGYQFVKGYYGIKRFPYAPDIYNVDRPVSELGAKAITEADGSGAGFTAGLQLRGTDMITLGLCYRSSIKLDLNGDITLIPEVSPGSNIGTEIGLPASVVFAIDYMPNEFLALEADVIWMEWSSFDKIAITADNPTLSYTSPKQLTDNVHFRLSLEYSAEDIAVFRTGYFYAPSPAPDEYLDPMIPNTLREGITLGIGWSYEQYTFDAAYLHSFKRDRYSDYSKILSNGRYEYKAEGFAVSLSYRID